MKKWIHEASGTVAELEDFQLMIEGWRPLEASEQHFTTVAALRAGGDRGRPAWVGTQRYAFTGKAWKKEEDHG